MAALKTPEGRRYSESAVQEHLAGGAVRAPGPCPQWKQGETIRSIGRSPGAEQHHVRRILAQSGGVRIQARRRAAGHLTLGGREEIWRGIAAGPSGRAIACGLNRSASTVVREISRNGDRERYRALDAEARAARQARRPKPAKPAVHSPLRQVVEERLQRCRSPQQRPSAAGPVVAGSG